MKRILYSLLVVLAMVSCDKIGQEDRFIEMQDVVTTDRKVLLVDFTGWKCVNCPEAAKVGNSLLAKHGENLIIVGMHPKGNSFVDPGSSGPDFGTDYGMEYMKIFGGTVSSGLPTGLIDNISINGSTFQDYQVWAAGVTERLQVPSDYKVKIEATETHCDVTVERKSGDPCDAGILLWLIEDSIVAPQASQTGRIDNYIHRHVFRKSLLASTDIADRLDLNAVQTSDTYSVDYELPELQGKHFAIVAAVVRMDGSYEVLQAEEFVIKGTAPEPEGPKFLVTFGDEVTMMFDDMPLADGDTLVMTEFDPVMEQMDFEGYIDIEGDESLPVSIIENRYFTDFENYLPTMCVFGNCIPGNGESSQTWGPFDFEAGSHNLFQAHMMIFDLETPVDLVDSYTFTDGTKSITVYVVFKYNY